MNLHLLDYADKIQRFTLYDIITHGKVVSVYDGDTFDMAILVPLSTLTSERNISKKKKGTCLICDKQNEMSMLMRMKCRIENINAPEMNTDEGLRAKEILESIIKDRIFKCRLGNYDKYGRVLITLLDEDENIKTYMEKYRLISE